MLDHQNLPIAHEALVRLCKRAHMRELEVSAAQGSVSRPSCCDYRRRKERKEMIEHGASVDAGLRGSLDGLTQRW